MKTAKGIIGILILGFLVACSTEQPAQNEELVKTVNVETEVLAPQLFERYLRLVGTVESRNDVRISAEVSGRIENYFVEKGGTIQKDEAILKIEDSKLRSEKARLEAQTEQAKEQYERIKHVFEQDSVGSEIDVINARSAYRQSKSALESIEVDLQNTMVRAPFDAILEDRFLEEGEMASPGAPLVRLIGSSKLKVTTGVPARYSDVVNEGEQVKIWFDTQESDTLSAEIIYVAKSIDPQNRTFKIEVELPSGSQNYKVDMIANLRLNTLSEDNVIVVSEEFVYKKDNEFITYVKGQNEQGDIVAEKRVVRLGPSYQSDVIIREGLQAGDVLITTGSAFLNEGMRLNIIEAEEEGALARQ
ncbi:MAG: efflux RND transporter periplasmic adaptor subunit [Balneolaceae bacterium]|nr:efflux RND transporter periplasmic adaptor subunit [Balneolaceae bacterium]